MLSVMKSLIELSVSTFAFGDLKSKGFYFLFLPSDEAPRLASWKIELGFLLWLSYEGLL